MFMETLTLYHGSSAVIAQPQFGLGRPYNDYGRGFYCTEHKELAREWACAQEGADGFANAYELDPEGFSVLRLSDPAYSVLHWLALLLEHRIVDARTSVAIEGKKYLREHFHIPVESYDLVIGWRADDSYFTFARAFLRNDISLEQLTRAMRLGDLGEQVVLKSERAFRHIRFLGAEAVPAHVYYPRRLARDERARALYREEAQRQGIEGVYMRDILQGRAEDYAGL